MSDFLISLENAGVRQGPNWSVRGISLSISEGEIVTLIGPNGSGKSTTTRMALGVLEPSEGVAKKRAGLRVGYVPQRFSLDWTLPMRVRRFMSLTGKMNASDMEAALSATDVLHLIDADVRTLSGGQMQRVMMARAIARKPQLLVLDEPVQGVDFVGEAALYELIVRIRDDLGCGVLLVSHDLHVVMAATDRVICLNGHMCCSGAPVAVANNPEYQALFGAKASAALAVYEHQHDHEHLPDGRVRHSDGSITVHCHPDDGHHHDHGSAKERDHAG